MSAILSENPAYRLRRCRMTWRKLILSALVIVVMTNVLSPQSKPLDPEFVCKQPPRSYSGLNKFTYGDGDKFLDPDYGTEAGKGLYWLPLNGHEDSLLKVW